MVYITLKELKKILPSILDSWIDEDDESWEWIFSEIEQKCHVVKKYKKKNNIEDDICWLKAMVDAQGIKNVAYKNNINKLESVLKENIDNVTQLSISLKDSVAEIRHLRNDVTAAKSMAQTAKQRTEVSYDQISKVKNDADVIQDVYNRMAGRGATRKELDGFRDLIHKYDALEEKEIPISVCNPEDKDCKTCRHYCGENPIDEPCIACYAYQCWEAKNE